ncbi:MAG: hypothetical protein COV98_02080, partial [Candidatus Altarchaeum sp. CG12_big_fil_rev_8_21_14_0_65_33_22]
MVRCSSSNCSFVKRENGKTEKFKGYSQIEDKDICKSIDELVLVLKLANSGVILLVECNNIPLRNEIIKTLNERINFKFYTIVLDEKNKNLPARMYMDFESKKIDEKTVVLVEGIENALPEIIGYLNWSREIFLKLKLRTIIFCPIYIMDEIIKSAPDFYRFANRITIKEKNEFVEGTKMQMRSFVSDIYYDNENELKDRIKIQEHLLSNAEDDYKVADISLNLGKMYLKICNYDKSIMYFKNSKNLYEKLNDKKGILMSIMGVGLVHNGLCDFKKAIVFLENSLKIAKEIGDKAGESKCYTNLGNAYQSLGDFRKAIEFPENSLKIFKEIGDKAGESACYTDLGVAYYNLGDFRKAIVFLENSLKIDKEIGDKAG